MELTIKEIIVRLILALIIGGLIGYEREMKNRAAGFRTHILVCLGATVVSLIQIDIGNKVIEMIKINETLSEVIKIDYGRLGAQVITGVGFIGAGTIIHTKRNIRGLTTAATLWIVACLGLSIGMGEYFISIFATIIIFVTLVFLKRIEDKFIAKNIIKEFGIKYYDEGNIKDEIEYILEKKKIKIRRIEYFIRENNSKEIYARYIITKPKNVNLDEVLQEIMNKISVLNIDFKNND